MNPIIDSHCHLQSLGEEAGAAMARARKLGVEGFLIPCIQLSESETILRLCEEHENVFCALGVHPHEAKTWRSGKDQAVLESLLNEPKVVAVGECGLDFFYDFAESTVQQRALREQWEVAIEHKFPVVVHNRDSNELMLEILEDPAYATLRADFHSFAGGREMGEVLLERGFYLGFTGMVTFKKAENVRELLNGIPRDQYLIETDTPYLAPVPYRGKPNEPAYVVEVGERVAQELESPMELVARETNENFFRLFDRARAVGRLA